MPVSPDHLAEREYHHLFPTSLLRDAGLSDSDAYLAVNCSLITWRTNRTISNKRPVEYLRERAEATELGESEIAARLRTHLVPYDKFAAAEGDSNIADAYRRFVVSRSRVIRNALELVWLGIDIGDLSPLFDDSDQEPPQVSPMAGDEETQSGVDPALPRG